MACHSIASGSPATSATSPWTSSGIEEIDLNAIGGADTITVNDQSATDLIDVNLDLGGSAGTGDGQADAVIINGTDGDDFGQIASFETELASPPT